VSVDYLCVLAFVYHISSKYKIIMCSYTEKQKPGHLILSAMYIQNKRQRLL